jgi:peptide/nickel transport system permease protein
MSLSRLVGRRLLLLLPTVLGILFLTFTLARIMPGDPTLTALGPRATPEQRARFRERYGLDRPLLEQYWRYLGSTLRGDFGDSLHTNRPVVRDVRDLWPATLELTTAALLITIVTGIPSGVLAARFKDRLGDQVARVGSLIGISMPIFWLGLLMLLVLSLWLDAFPTGGRLSTGIPPPPRVTGLYVIDTLVAGNWSAFRNALYHLTLPAVCLAFAVVGVISRMVRNAMLEVLHQDYIRTAHSKGVSEFAVLFRHALRNALMSVLTVSGILYAQLLGGAVLTETIFSWPGLGRYTVEAILHLDYPPIMAVTVLTSLVYVVVNLLIDVLYGVADPRVRT